MAEAGPVRDMIRRSFARSALERGAKTAEEKAAVAKALTRENRKSLNSFIDGLGEDFDESYGAGGSWQDFFKWLIENLPAIIAAIMALFA